MATQAAAALTNVGLFWENEQDAKERNALLRIIFEKVWVDGHQVHALAPRWAFLPYFEFGQESGGKERERRDSFPRFTPSAVIRQPSGDSG